MFVWLCLIPAVEAAEQTILQKVVPPERQGRVFGFAQSVEQAASPVTAFLIGPVAQLIFIPFMTTGAGVDTLGSWFGTGPDRAGCHAAGNAFEILSNPFGSVWNSGRTAGSAGRVSGVMEIDWFEI
jgi:hypothetical protein